MTILPTCRLVILDSRWVCDPLVNLHNHPFLYNQGFITAVFRWEKGSDAVPFCVSLNADFELNFYLFRLR